MAKTAHQLIDNVLDEMDFELSKIYAEAEKDILKKSQQYFEQFKKEDAKMLKRVADGKMTEPQYKAWRKKKLMQGKRYSVMREDIAKRLLSTNEIATAYINGQLPKVYMLGYNDISGAVDGFGGYSFNLLNEDAVRNLAKYDDSLLPIRAVDSAVDIAWNKKKVSSQILQGILQGESIDDIANRIVNVSGMNKDTAVGAARTFVTSAENKGRMDSYKRVEKDGLVLRKYWIATPGPRTRPWHAEAGAMYSKDKAIPMDEPFVVDGENMMFPGDATEASGKNLYNCRCTMASTVVDYKKPR